MLILWNIAKYQISNAVGFDIVSTTEYYKKIMLKIKNGKIFLIIVLLILLLFYLKIIKIDKNILLDLFYIILYTTIHQK